MGIAYNTSIVRDGLVLYLDAANKKSYPATGTTWNDLSGNGRNGTLSNSPSFSGGSFLFDGTNQLVTIPNNIQFGSTSFSIEMVVKIPTLNYEAICSWNNDGFNTDSKGLSIRFRSPGANIEYALNDGAGVATRLQIPSLALNTWYHITYTHNFNGVISAYVNSVFIDSMNYSSSGNSPYSDVYNLLLARDSNDFGNIHLPIFKVYNRALSAAEVQQNFNAVRGRYNV
jgi:hypothetical protein